jgi:gliding motility-associated-like protein
MIFDRWGSKIFETTDLEKGWDGRVQGKPEIAQQDVYVWKVELTDPFNKEHQYVGHVTLLR